MDDDRKVRNADGRRKKQHKAKDTFEKYGTNTTKGARVKEEKKDTTEKKKKSWFLICLFSLIISSDYHSNYVYIA